jgi:crotonobetainyl-CoA:carnitine CoA-transferase CaiB-like acyl-CoA transferase
LNLYKDKEMPDPAQPFAGLLVLEFASVLAGPLVGQFFAELGAKVIKVENLLTAGDVTRKWKLPSEAPEPDVSAYFSCANWGKLSAGMDLRDGEALRLVHQIVRQADIVIASFKPGDAEKLQLDYPTLSSLKPRLIYGHITGYGPDSSRAGYDAVVQAESGFMFLNGQPEGPPTKMPVALMDLMAAHHLKEGILTALYLREKTGQGRLVEVSLLEAAIASLANQAAGYLVAGSVPTRIGSEHPSIVPYGTVFSTKEGEQIVLAVGDDRQFRALCEVLKVPALADDDRYRTNAGRVQNRSSLRAELTSSISTRAKKELLEKLAQRHVPAGAIHTLPEVMQLPFGQEMLLAAEDPGAFPFSGVRTVAFRWDGQKTSLLARPPHYGEHTDFVLATYAGADAGMLAAMKQKSIIYQR